MKVTMHRFKSGLRLLKEDSRKRFVSGNFCVAGYTGKIRRFFSNILVTG